MGHRGLSQGGLRAALLLGSAAPHRDHGGVQLSGICRRGIRVALTLQVLLRRPIQRQGERPVVGPEDQTARRGAQTPRARGAARAGVCGGVEEPGPAVRHVLRVLHQGWVRHSVPEIVLQYEIFILDVDFMPIKIQK